MAKGNKRPEKGANRQDNASKPRPPSNRLALYQWLPGSLEVEARLLLRQTLANLLSHAPARRIPSETGEGSAHQQVGARIELVEAVLDMLRIDLGHAYEDWNASRQRVESQFEAMAVELATDYQYRATVRDILGILGRLDVEVIRLIVNSMPSVGNRIRSLKSFERQAERVGLSKDTIAVLHREVSAQIETLSSYRALIESLDMGALARKTRDPTSSRKVRELAAVFLHLGYSKGKSYRRTASILAAWDPKRYGAVTEEHVRLRCERPPRTSL